MTIALWCVLVIALIPMLLTGLAKALGGRYDNHDPRGHAGSYSGMAKRAHAAHQNAFEAFPLFAVAVLIAELKGGPRLTVDTLAIAYVALRLAYSAAYIYNRPSLRSTLWVLALIAAIAIFVSPLWR